MLICSVGMVYAQSGQHEKLEGDGACSVRIEFLEVLGVKL